MNELAPLSTTWNSPQTLSSSPSSGGCAVNSVCVTYQKFSKDPVDSSPAESSLDPSQEQPDARPHFPLRGLGGWSSWGESENEVSDAQRTRSSIEAVRMEQVVPDWRAMPSNSLSYNRPGSSSSRLDRGGDDCGAAGAGVCGIADKTACWLALPLLALLLLCCFFRVPSWGIIQNAPAILVLQGVCFSLLLLCCSSPDVIPHAESRRE